MCLYSFICVVCVRHRHRRFLITLLLLFDWFGTRLLSRTLYLHTLTHIVGFCCFLRHTLIPPFSPQHIFLDHFYFCSKCFSRISLQLAPASAHLITHYTSLSQRTSYRWNCCLLIVSFIYLFTFGSLFVALWLRRVSLTHPHTLVCVLYCTHWNVVKRWLHHSGHLWWCTSFIPPQETVQHTIAKFKWLQLSSGPYVSSEKRY